jgi:hypothetical protein
LGKGFSIFLGKRIPNCPDPIKVDTKKSLKGEEVSMRKKGKNSNEFD